MNEYSSTLADTQDDYSATTQDDYSERYDNYCQPHYTSERAWDWAIQERADNYSAWQASAQMYGELATVF